MAEMQPSISPANERILAVIGNLTLVGGFMGIKQKAYSLILTDQRMVFAELTKATVSATMSQARGDAKAAGKGTLGQWAAQVRAPSNHHNKYWELPLSVALNESPNNFAVERSAIKKVKFKTGIVDDTHNQSDQVTIKTTSKSYKMNVNGSLSAAKEGFRTAGLG